MDALIRVLRRVFPVALIFAVAAVLLSPVGMARAQAPAAASQQPLAIPAARQAGNVAIITIHGPITSVTAKSVARRLKLAERSGADAVVIDLDTPGGEMGAALEICNSIKQCPITNTVAWINPNAYSAGSVIALACREIVTNDPGTMGDALPIAIGPKGVMPVPEHERQKFTAPLLSEVVDSARRRGYDEYLVQGIVALGVELWLVENAQTGQRMCINRAEYLELFGSTPPPQRPRLVSARAGIGVSPDVTDSRGPRHSASDPAAPAPDAAPGSTGSDPAAPAGESPAATPATPRPALPGDPPPLDFKPAAPRLEKVGDTVSLNLETQSQRPPITAADRGKWKLVEYVSDGNGPFTFKPDDLIAMRLAVAKIHNDAELEQFFGAQNMQRLDQNWSETLVLVLTNDYVRGLLIAVFLVAMVLEMLHPGVILPGAIATASLVLLLGPALFIGMANWWEIAAIGAGIVLLGVEVLILPGFGIPGVVGMMLLFVGLIGTFVGQGSGIFPSSAGGRSELLGGLVTVLTSFVSAGLAVYFISRNLSSIPVFNKMVLKPGVESDEEAGDFDVFVPAPSGPAVGDVGTAITPLRPSGKGQFGDRVVDVSSALGYVDAGTPVRVVTADAFQVVVEPVDVLPGGAALS